MAAKPTKKVITKKTKSKTTEVKKNKKIVVKQPKKVTTTKPKAVKPTPKKAKEVEVAVSKKVRVPKVKATPTVEVSPLKPTVKKNYLNNKDLMLQVVKSKEQKQMTNELANMLMTLVNRYAKKGNFAGYSYNDDMRGYAIMMLVKTWDAFKPEKSNNPFAFYTQCVKNSFVQYLNHEQRQRDVKNEVLIGNGLNPSYSYVLDHEADHHKQHDSLSVDQTDMIRSPFFETVDREMEPVDGYNHE